MSLHFTRSLDRRLTIEKARSMPTAMKQLYERSFPAEERRPQAALDAAIASESIDLWLIQADGADIGFLTINALPSGVNYIEHFAVEDSMRGSGVGSAALSLMSAMNPGPMVLEAEPAGTNPMAARRIGFYRRLGFELWDRYPYIQPAYAPGLDSPELRLMTRGIPADSDIHALATEIRREVYGAPEQAINDADA